MNFFEGWSLSVAKELLFEKLGTLRHRLLQRAGRFTRPNGVLTLTLSGNKIIADEISNFIDAAAVIQ